jgi:Icc protein
VKITRRSFLRKGLAAGAALFLVPGLETVTGSLSSVLASDGSFRFALLGDSHLMGAKNPRLETRLETAIREINRIDPAPDFVVFMGDAVHDGTPEQLIRFSKIISGLKAKTLFIPGEHDWYFDMGQSYQTHVMKEKLPVSFHHKGYQIILLNGIHLNDFWSEKNLTAEQRMEIAGTLNKSPGPFQLGQEQIRWLQKELSGLDRETPILLFIHPPLYHYYRKWNFWVEDAPEAHRLLRPFKQVSVFHGHVHQIVRNEIDRIRFYSTLATSWPYPYPPSGVPNGSPRMPRPSPSNFYDGLGWAMDEAGQHVVQQEDKQWTLNPPESES